MSYPVASGERRRYAGDDLAARRVEGDDLAALQARLAARRWGCWIRFEDAISELYALHEVPEEEIFARARAAIDRERAAASAPPQASASERQ